ncbi:cytochrome ubiquinol oxidase subunit I [Phenylobacterium deserti]|uniref:Cytochrome ubiquinol oxidase subunit I n=1 Tax=Phenylobacterium deserti TaxID=1914756 RepID=A0A328AVJ7_9CAUL|nr:cytochrome ubiquinol oxidase subunit I [Phenylobacterium deserti]RAK57584.1 cytochrome ubiquinol oxidase subunit I [Phenylobacterium deserti]
MDFDALLLSRIQFAFVVSFHILFPAFTIGLASYLWMLELQWLRTKQPVYIQLFRFWVKLFAVSFGLGVVSGIIMSYQFGTNWSRLSYLAGPVIGPLMQYEVLTAFFMEAAFLGIMLFGWNKVGPKLHFLATSMVALGTVLSTFWIISTNSWMQTPQGFTMEGDRFVPVDWWAIVFNPSFPNRLLHMVLAAYLTTCFVVAGVSAWHLWKGKAPEAARKAFSMAMWFAAIVTPLQIAAGDLQGLAVLDQQPTKLAAIEGHWETRRGAPLILFAVPNESEERNDFEIAVPKLGSIILTHDPNGEIRGLKEWPRDRRPPVKIPFYSFRIMVGIGFAMLFIALAGLFLRWRKRLYDSRWFLLLCMAMTPSGFIAVLTGWFTAEVGRQPWVVYGYLRTADAVSPVPAASVAASLATFMVVYLAIFSAGTFYMLRLIAAGPDTKLRMDDAISPAADRHDKRAKRPLSVPDESPDPSEPTS